MLNWERSDAESSGDHPLLISSSQDPRDSSWQQVPEDPHLPGGPQLCVRVPPLIPSMAAPTVHGSQCHGQQVAEYPARVLMGEAWGPWAVWGMSLAAMVLMESVGIPCAASETGRPMSLGWVA